MNILTANGSASRTNATLQETLLTPATVAPGKFGKIGSLAVDGQVYAQVLFVSALNIPDLGMRDVAFVSTMHNSVYAFDVSSNANGNRLWQVNLGPSVPSVADIYPEIGILSTGAIDLAQGVLYVVSETETDSGVEFSLHALDLTSGAERLNGPVVIAAAVADASEDAPPDQTISIDPVYHLQRPGLLLANGSVYVAFGSHSDYGQWHGWVVRFDSSDVTRQLAVFATTPAGGGGAIWQAGRGLAADASGNLYAVSGNGDYDGTQNFGESVLKLNGSLDSPADWFTPANWEALSDGDEDLSAGPALIDTTRTLIAADKAGDLYLINADSMGHLSGGGAYSLGTGEIFNLAAWPLASGALVYVQPNGGPLSCYAIGGTRFGPDPVSSTPMFNSTGRTGLTLSANGSDTKSGILWAYSDSATGTPGSGTLHAFNALNLAEELWNSDLNPDTDALGALPKFVSPTVANGRVYAPTFSNAVAVYGLASADLDARRTNRLCRQNQLVGAGRACFGARY